MTFRVHFFAEKAYLSFVKETLSNPNKDHEKNVERGAICIISLACALEAMVNLLLKDYTTLRHFDDLRFRSKIETLHDFGKIPCAWDRMPLQGIAELIRLRDWLVHYKDNNIGLINSEGEWLSDDLNKHPKRNPDVELISSNVKKLYQSVRETVLVLAKVNGAEDDFEYLEIEEYNAFLVG
jgi:hypothetical protein